MNKEIQERLNAVKYPQNHYYNIDTLEPLGLLLKRVKVFEEICPEIFAPVGSFLDIGSSLGFFLFKSLAKEATGIEPDLEAFEVSDQVRKYRNSNVKIFNSCFDSFKTDEKFDLIFLGNVFHYLYRKEGWAALAKLATMSKGLVVMELPLQGEYLVRNGWTAGDLMNDYTGIRYIEEARKYFHIDRIGPSATGDGKERVITVLKIKGD